MKFHPVANLFPLMDDEKLKELAEDIKANGLLEPGYVYGDDDELLDGRNRYLACGMAGIDFEYHEYKGDDPVAFVHSLNYQRRQLTQGQKAVYWARRLNYFKVEADKAKKEAGKKYGQNHPKEVGAKLPQPLSRAPKAVEMAAKEGDVSGRYIQDAKKLLEIVEGKEGKTGDKTKRDILDAVEKGKINISAAKELVRLPKKDRKEILNTDTKELMSKVIKQKKQEINRAERIEKLTDINDNNTKLGTDKKYNIIYADPPWQYEHSKSTSRDIENQYPTMTFDEICELQVGDIAEDNALLFLWTTVPKAFEAMKVLDAWGFKYVTNCAWDKINIGMGYHFRQQHELLYIAKKGFIPCPPPELRPSSVYREKKGKHSSKPVYFHELIESWYPELSKIELFCRTPRKGWNVWGNQSNGEN